MIITGDLSESPLAGPVLASIDVEWSKNYRIRNGNVPFCYSIMWATLPAQPVPLAEVTWSYTSRYVESAEETQELISAADTAFGRVLDTAAVITGHQLSSDLATLINAAHRPVPHLRAMRDLWHERRTVRPAPLLDTRYDVGHLLSGASRRLVDVCTELQLDVTQRELRNTSMTALHRRWLTTGDVEARERITVLNLRHSLSTGLVALLSGHHVAAGGVNVNHLLARHLTDTYGWLKSPTFTDLL